MAQINYNTNKRSFKHLSPIDRGKIYALRKEGKTIEKIADIIGKHKSTISRELHRGKTTQKKKQDSYMSSYFPEVGQLRYENKRKLCGRKSKLISVNGFIKYAEKCLLKKKWSPDSIVGRAKKTNNFLEKIVCAKTLYNYIDQGLLNVKSIDLLLKVRRNTKVARIRKNKKSLGRSISERPEIVQTRTEFGHWEIDTVIGKKSKDNVLLTLVERKTRANITIKIDGKNEKSVNATIKKYQKKLGVNFSQIFKTITADNGSEFSSLTKATEHLLTDVYFTHPYSSYERGSNEKHNSLIRRFIPKGREISSFSLKQIKSSMDWCNNLPRKILSYKTPLECFEQEIKLLNLA